MSKPLHTGAKVLLLIVSIFIVVPYISQLRGPLQSLLQQGEPTKTAQSSTATINHAQVQAKRRQPQIRQVEQTVYVTRTGEKYHSAGCRYLRTSSIPLSLSEAKKVYSPCSVCNPQ